MLTDPGLERDLVKQGRHSPKEGKDREPIKLFPYLSLLVLCCCQAPVQCSKPSANSIRQDGAIVSNHSNDWMAGGLDVNEKRNPVQGISWTAVEALRSPFLGSTATLCSRSRRQTGIHRLRIASPYATLWPR